MMMVAYNSILLKLQTSCKKEFCKIGSELCLAIVHKQKFL